jgi:hypothetical protein
MSVEQWRKDRDEKQSWAHLEHDQEAKGRQADAFHNHLDNCKQCRNNPFNMCPAGDALIKAAVR